MSWQTSALVIGLVLALVLILFRRTLSALVYDYVVDFGLSSLDNFLGGAGLLGLDIGDFLAALIIFFKERRITGGFFALLAAWEAANFFPVGLAFHAAGDLLALIPYVGPFLGPAAGESFEVVTNLLPSVTICRILFSKYGAADREAKRLRANVATARAAHIAAGTFEEHQPRIARDLSHENPVGALWRARHANADVSHALERAIRGLMEVAGGWLRQLKQVGDAPEEALTLLEQGAAAVQRDLAAAERALRGKDYAAALAAAQAACAAAAQASAAFDAAIGSPAA